MGPGPLRIVFLFLIPQVWNLVEGSLHSKRHEPLEIIHNTVLEIYEHLKKQDKFQDIKDLLQMDSTLKKIEQQNEELLKRLGSNLGRSGVSDSSVQQLENKLDNIEERLVTNAQGGIKKMADVEKQTNELKNDMDKKLQKMMNVMSSVYDMSLKVSDKFGGGEKGEAGVEGKGIDMANFMTEYFEGIEKKIVEFLSVMQVKFKAEISELGSSMGDMHDTCNGLLTDVAGIKDQCELSNQQNSKQEIDQKTLVRMTENIVQNLTRHQREITEKMEKQILDLETKVSQQFVSARSSKEPKVTALPRKENDLEKTVTDNPKACTTTSSATTPRCCWQLYKSGATCSGTYIIYPQNKKAIFANCDMDSYGGGWTVLMRRGNFSQNNLNFDRNWSTYKSGFGEVDKEFWLGNDNIHYLTKQEEMVLQIILESFNNEKVVLEYEPFSVASESQNYKLHIGRIKGNLTYIGSSIRHHNQRPFSTFDRNNGGETAENCAARYKGGWWYNRCHYALLTAPYYKENENRDKWQGMQWHAWKGNEILKSAEMRIRPKNRN